MLCVGDSIARGIGIFGAVNLVQVRSTIKDTRDLMFVHHAVAGSPAWARGHRAGGHGAFAIAILFQSFTDFGARRGVSAVLRVKVNAAALMTLPGVLAKHTTRAVLASSRSLPDESAEQTYQLRLSGTTAQAALLADLPGAGVSESSMLLQDDSLEV
jgi:hypothetical protein